MKILVCGTRIQKGRKIDRNFYRKLVWDRLEELYWKSPFTSFTKFMIIEGCCKDSADEFAESWARTTIKNPEEVLDHNPSKTGEYLKRNIEMVHKCDAILAFWDGFSYGTAHTIAQGVAWGKKVRVVMIK